MRKITHLLLLLFVNSVFAQIQLQTAVNEYLDNNNWIPSNNETAYRYDTNGNLIKEGSFHFDTATNKWVKTQETLYTYNTNNRLVEEVYKRFPYQSIPESGSKTNYTYNSNNDLIETIYYELVDGSWELLTKEEIEYDTNNRPSIINEYDWDEYNTIWEIDSKSTATYNSEGKIEVINIQVWENSSWVNDRKQTYSYNNGGKLIEELHYEVGYLGIKTEYQYDANGNMINEKKYYDYSNGTWGSNSETIYTYDTTQLMSDFIHPFKDKTGLEYISRGIPYINKLLVRYNSTTDREVFKYGNATASNSNYRKNQLSIYPNPTEDFLTIDIKNNETLKKVNVFTLLGNKILTTTENTFSIQNLSKGMYLLEIETENGKIATQKIVKK